MQDQFQKMGEKWSDNAVIVDAGSLQRNKHLEGPGGVHTRIAALWLALLEEGKGTR